MRLKTLLLSAGALLAAATGAQAALIPTLASITNNGSDFTWNYDVTLSGDTGLVSGHRFVLFDFTGYVPGSVASPYSFFTASTELITTGLLTVPGEVDDPNKANLVFTYNGAPYHTSSGPFAPTDYLGFTARSIYGAVARDTFAAITVKNNPNNRPGGTGTPVYDAGYITVPAVGAIPEPATWAMMLTGFGGAGLLLRRRRSIGVAA